MKNFKNIKNTLKDIIDTTDNITVAINGFSLKGYDSWKSSTNIIEALIFNKNKIQEIINLLEDTEHNEEK